MQPVEDKDYNTDDTIDYWTPGNKDNPPVCEVVEKKTNVKLDQPKRCLISSKPSKGSFKVSLHGVQKRKGCTYLMCKAPGSK